MIDMATNSFLKNINIKGRSQTQKLVSALERSESNRGKEVKMSRSVVEIKGEGVRDFLKNYRRQSR